MIAVLILLPKKSEILKFRLCKLNLGVLLEVVATGEEAIVEGVVEVFMN